MSGKRAENRNTGIDCLRFICSLLVVCIHVPAVGGNIIVPIARSAVPVFAMITGYYFSETERHHKLAKHIWKIFKLALSGQLLYLALGYLTGFVMAGVPLEMPVFCAFAKEWTRYLIFESDDIWRQLFLFGVTSYGVQLWYLNALLVTMIFVAVWRRFFDRKRLYVLIPLLLISNLLLGAYSMPVLGQQFKMEYSRNALFTILPFFLMGDILYVYRDRLKFSASGWCVLLVLSLLSVQLERIVLEEVFSEASVDLYFSTIISSVALLMLAVSDFGGKSAPGTAEFFARLGRKYSTGLYILHTMVAQIAVALITLVSRWKPEAARLSSCVSALTVILATLFLLAFADRLRDALKKLWGERIWKKAQ